MKKKRNPLSYLGFLGFVGFFGVVLWTPAVAVLLLFFFFFGYGSMPADELFWENVRRAGLRAFTVSTAMGTLFIVAWFANSLWMILTGRNGEQALEIANGVATLSEYALTIWMLLGTFFVLTFVTSLCVFVMTLWRMDRKERKFLEADLAADNEGGVAQ